jgi:hypothetical protein
MANDYGQWGVEDFMTGLDEGQQVRLSRRVEAIAGLEDPVALRGPTDKPSEQEPNRLAQAVLEIRAGVKTLLGKDWVDEAAIADQVLARLAGRSVGDIAEALLAVLPAKTARALAPLLAAAADPEGP